MTDKISPEQEAFIRGGIAGILMIAVPLLFVMFIGRLLIWLLL